MIGDKSLIAFELGENVDGSKDLFKLDLWVLGQLVTRNDDIAFLKSIVNYALGDRAEKRDLNKYASRFSGLSATESHHMIMETRNPKSESYKEDDQIWNNQQVLDWGPNTDNVYCFIIPIDSSFYITLSWTNSNKVYSSKIDLKIFDNTLNKFIECANKNLTIYSE